jgi:ACS family tartrate transporter-like MFS transporter
MKTVSERAVLGKVTRRLIPFLFVLYIFNYLDRTNVGVAGLTMKADLAFSDKAWGLGLGIFFLGYFFFEVPSNLVLQRIGARVWIARIMLTWGVISSAMMFVRSPNGFYAMRFLLGVAEAGFFPGMILYLTYWFPAGERAKAVSRFMTAIPLAGVLGGLISGAVLKELSGVAGLKGWQWIFVAEGVPSVLLGLVTLFYLTDRPAVAEWLSPEERSWLTERIRREQEHRDRHHTFTLAQAFARPVILLLCGVYFTNALCNYGANLWMPLILKSRAAGWSDQAISAATAVPAFIAAIAMVLNGTHSDRSGERRWHLAGAFWAGAVGLGVAAQAQSPVLTLAAFSLTALGITSCLGPFWALSTSVMSGAAAAGAIAYVNSVGNLGGILGPYLIGGLKSSTGDFALGLYTLAGVMLAGGVLSLLVRHDPAVDRRIAEGAMAAEVAASVRQGASTE